MTRTPEINRAAGNSSHGSDSGRGRGNNCPPENNQTRQPATVLVVGAGGLGSAIILALAANSNCQLLIVDQDRVEESNLNRQILHPTHHMGLPKAQSAVITLKRLFPQFGQQTGHSPIGLVTCIDQSNVDSLLDGIQIVVDGTDNFQTRFILNDACVRRGIPFVHAGVLGTAGQAFSVIPGLTPCYRCVLGQVPPPDLTPTAATAGILGAAAGFIGAIEAGEVIALLQGTDSSESRSEDKLRSPLTGNMLLWDGLTSTFRILAIPGPPSCPVCREAASQNKLGQCIESGQAAVVEGAAMGEAISGMGGEVLEAVASDCLPPAFAPHSPVREASAARYARNILLPWLGETGQSRLLQSSVTITSSNTTISPAVRTAAAYLCAAGVRAVNLHLAPHAAPQVLPHQAAESLKYLGELNPDSTVRVQPITSEQRGDSYSDDGEASLRVPREAGGKAVSVDLTHIEETIPPELHKLQLLPEAVGAMAAFKAIRAAVRHV